MPTTVKLVGGAPNQVPRNKDLGNLAYQNAESIAGPVAIGGALTLNQGAINGVTYLNANKVLTAGSALTFDGTALKIGTTGATNYRLLLSRGGTAGELAQFTDGSAQSLTFDSDASSILINSANGGALRFGVTTEQMRLTSTGLGIGTSSPANKLDVRAAVGSGNLIRLENTSAFNASNVVETSFVLANATTGIASVAAFGAYNQFPQGNNYGNIYFKTANPTEGLVTRMLLDFSGNLGLGVTPSAWGTQWKAMQVNTGASLYGNTSHTVIGQNMVGQTASDNYISNGFASRYIQAGGAHQFFTAPSGTAGNAISFTQAMTLDANGNLLVGKTSGIHKIETVGAGLDGQGTTSVTTTATTIYALKQSSTGVLCVIFGDNGTDGFMDLIFVLANVTPQVITSKTIYGSPSARTYTQSATAVRCALASGSLFVRTSALSTLST